MAKDKLAKNIRVAAWDFLDSLLSVIEAMPYDVECDCSGGILEVTNGEKVYLISWHEPSEQLLVASPISGSMRFVYDQDRDLWCDTKNSEELVDFVKREISAVFDDLGSEL